MPWALKKKKSWRRGIIHLPGTQASSQRNMADYARTCPKKETRAQLSHVFLNCCSEMLSSPYEQRLTGAFVNDTAMDASRHRVATCRGRGGYSTTTHAALTMGSLGKGKDEAYAS